MTTPEPIEPYEMDPEELAYEEEDQIDLFDEDEEEDWDGDDDWDEEEDEEDDEDEDEDPN